MIYGKMTTTMRSLIQRLLYSLVLVLTLLFKNQVRCQVTTKSFSSFSSSSIKSTNSSIRTLTSLVSLHPDSAMVQEELLENTWDYMTELVFIPFLAILSIPANIFLFTFYAKKVRFYKRLKHFNKRYASVANSFHSYMIEISAFDIVIVFYLILNSTFHLLYFLKKSQYESVYDISNFACKFFIYILRISGAMSNYLVFLLSLNRCFLLILRQDNEDEINSHRLCLNTKYLTLFLFCLCTIANVFRLELLYLNSSSQVNNPNNNNNTSPNLLSPDQAKLLEQLGDEIGDEASKNQLLQMLSEAVAQKSTECGPNIGSIDYKADSTHNKLFWSIIIYNIIFAILPAFGNLATSVYLIRKRYELKRHLVYLSERIGELRNKSHAYITLLRSHKPSRNEPNNEIGEEADTEMMEQEPVTNIYFEESLIRELKNLQITEYQAEFLRTCSPCIAFSLTHVFLFLPYSCIEMINQISTNFTLLQALQYMTYARYLFYSCKFYLLFLVSYRFRHETITFFRCDDSEKRHRSDCESNLIESFRRINVYQQQQPQRCNEANENENVTEATTGSKNKLDIIVTNS